MKGERQDVEARYHTQNSMLAQVVLGSCALISGYQVSWEQLLKLKCMSYSFIPIKIHSSFDISENNFPYILVVREYHYRKSFTDTTNK